VRGSACDPTGKQCGDGLLAPSSPAIEQKRYFELPAMIEKLPKTLIQELDGLMKQLSQGNAEQRGVAMSRLLAYERSGKIALPLLLEMADETNPSIAMYAITALGRSGHPQAVRKLLALAAAHREGNSLLLETIVDALGETRSKEATPALLELLGLAGSWTSRLLGRFSRRNEEQQARLESLHTRMALPVTRALEKIGDPRAAEALAPFLDHEDPLVRYHTIRAAINAGFARNLERIRQMAESDRDATVKELAQIALTKLASPPDQLRN
jgi:HEAT repeat protein